MGSGPAPPATIWRVSEQPAPERPGRYQRSTSGLIGAMIVTVLAVLVFVGFRALNRDRLEVTPERVDYLATVSALQADGRQPVYPATLPKAWTPTSVDVSPAQGLDWGVGILTDDRRFAGVRQSSGSLRGLLHTYVDKEAAEGEPVTISGAIATSWRTFSDSGGDHAFAAVVGGDQVLVYGSASESQLRTVVLALTRDPLAR